MFSLQPVLEVMENIEVYHKFWFEEVTNLTNKLDIQMKLPGKFHRAQQGNLDSQLSSESYYRETLSVLTAEHIIQKLKSTFSEQHLTALNAYLWYLQSWDSSNSTHQRNTILT
jgi:hypothetical protein